MACDDRHLSVESARLRAELTVQELWLRYIALGGNGDAFDVDGYLQGLVSLDTFEQDVLAQAVNEELADTLRAAWVPLSISVGDGPGAGLLDRVVAPLLKHRPEGTAGEI